VDGGEGHGGRYPTDEKPKEAAVYSKVKIFGHPIHPALISFPVAFYTATLVAYVIYAASSHHFWLRVAIAANVAGVVMAVVAAIPGFVDWAFGIPSGTRAKGHGLRHLILNVSALVLFAIVMFTYVGRWNGANPSAVLAIVLAAVGVVLTIGAGMFGWTLIQDDHVGVRLSPEQAELERRASTTTPGLRRAS
jgi:uncharacterized membrane protein